MPETTLKIVSIYWKYGRIQISEDITNPATPLGFLLRRKGDLQWLRVDGLHGGHDWYYVPSTYDCCLVYPNVLNRIQCWNRLEHPDFFEECNQEIKGLLREMAE